MKKPTVALAVTLLTTAFASTSQAQSDPASFNASLVSDYRYRGISQTRLAPALQGGADYASPAGWYVGTWASTIKWIKDAGGDANVEIDIYGGYKGEIAKDVGYDVGLLQYVYPGARTATWDAIYKNPNTTELYAAVTFGPATAKVSYALTNLFGNFDFTNDKKSSGSYYLDLSASFDVGAGITLVPHIGYQEVKNIANASYTDLALTASKDFSGFLVSLGVVGTDANETFYVPGAQANSTEFLGKTAVVLSVKYTF
jgi:uncharacterized protein (TIGR02001 family)